MSITVVIESWKSCRAKDEKIKARYKIKMIRKSAKGSCSSNQATRDYKSSDLNDDEKDSDEDDDDGEHW